MYDAVLIKHRIANLSRSSGASGTSSPRSRYAVVSWQQHLDPEKAGNVRSAIVSATKVGTSTRSADFCHAGSDQKFVSKSCTSTNLGILEKEP